MNKTLFFILRRCHERDELSTSRTKNESVNDDGTPEEESFTSAPKDVNAEADAVHEVNEITQPLGIPEIGYDAEPELPNGREYSRPGILDEPVDESL